MVAKVLGGLALVIGILAVVVSMQPSEFRVTRSAVIAASPQEVFAQINDFHNWNNWSPWAKLDPNAKYSFEGPQAGNGAVFRWAGNDKVGEGSNTIIDSRPNELVRIKLDFIKPFPGTSTAEFTFQPQNGQTLVTWSMSGVNNFIGKAFGLIMNCDKMVGGQFEEGFKNLKTVVEK